MKSVEYYVGAGCERPIQPAPRSDNYSNPRVGADHGVDFDWSRQSKRDCPDVSANILNSVQQCRSSSSKGANSVIEQYRT